MTIPVEECVRYRLDGVVHTINVTTKSQAWSQLDRAVTSMGEKITKHLAFNDMWRCGPERCLRYDDLVPCPCGRA